MQPPPPAYTTADAAARADIMADCGLHDAMTQHSLRSQRGRSPHPRTQSYSSLITPAAAAAHPPAAPPKVEGMSVEEGPLRHHRYDMGVIRESKVFSNMGEKLERLCGLFLATCLIAGIVLVAWGCTHKPHRVRWAVVTGTVMLCIFSAWFFGYMVVWKNCGDEDYGKTEGKIIYKDRVIRMVVFYCLAVLGTGIGLLVWGSKHKPHRVQAAVLAGAILLGAHAAIAAALFVCCGCGND